MKRKGKPTHHCSKHDNQNPRETHHRKSTNSRTFPGKFQKKNQRNLYNKKIENTREIIHTEKEKRLEPIEVGNVIQKRAGSESCELRKRERERKGTEKALIV